MAQIEPMDIDAIESDFDNKENTFQHNNVLSRTPCTEKGYEELDVSELNMKLRYSLTPASSPMSKSLTGPCLDNRNCNPGEDYLNNTVGTENGNLTRSLNSTLTRSESATKSKVLPLQTLSADQFVDNNRNSSMRRLIEPDNNIIISVDTNDDNLSLPSTSSSVTNTPEATTPTKENPKPEGSPIMRGLKSVLSMFRPSQSPIPLADDKAPKPDILSPIESRLPMGQTDESDVPVQASTPVAASKKKDSSSRRSSPLKESVVFNDDLERELQWKDETTIIFKEEKIPVHKLFFQNPITSDVKNAGQMNNRTNEQMNTTVEYMDISCNESVIADRTMTDVEQSIPVKIEGAIAVESDNEFLDCETTFTKNESCVSDYKEMEVVNKTDVINNVTVDLTENAPIKVTDEFESKNMNVTQNINKEVIEASEKSLAISQPVTDIVARSLVENSSRIIEATMGMLKSESYNHAIIDEAQSVLVTQEQNVNLQSESLVRNPNESKELNINDGKIITNDEKIPENIECHASATVDGKIDDLNINRTFESKSDFDETKVMCNEILSEGVICNNDNLPDICAVKLNDTEYSNVINIENSPVELKDNKSLDVLDNDTVVDMKNATIDSICCDVVVKEKVNDTISVSNNVMQHVPDNLENTQIIQVVTNPDLLESNNSNLKFLDSEIPIPIDNKNLSEIVHSSITHESCTTVANLHPTELMKVDDVMATHSMGAELNVEPNVSNIDVECKQVDNTTFNTTNSEDNLNVHTTNNLESPVDIIQTSHIESNIANAGLRENDREIPEVRIGNDMVTSKEPSEIPLPDEDDIEQAVTESFNVCTEVVTAQDVTFEVCNMSIDLESSNKPLADITMTVDDKGNINQSLKDETCPPSAIIEHNVDNIGNVSVIHCELNEIQACNMNTQRANLDDIKSELHIDNICAITENLTHSEIDSKIAMSNIQFESALNDKSPEHIDAHFGAQNMPNIENICGSLNALINSEDVKENALVDAQNMPNPENICESTNILINSEDVKENISHTAEPITLSKEDINAAGLLDIVKSEHISNVDKFENVNQVKVDDNVQNEKVLQEIDVEIITSANNSPYVSVTDLALDTEANKESLENTENPFETKTKMFSSPPISPKIVSKGYNFNFDDIDDPFATKTKIRMSPTPDSPNQTCNTFKENEKLEEVSKKVNNRRKSQPERKKTAQKKNLNKTFHNKLPTKETVSEKNIDSQIISTPTEAILSNDILNSNASPSVTADVSDVILENAITISQEVKKENINNDSEITTREEIKKENESHDNCEMGTVAQNTTIQKEEIHQVDEEMKIVEPSAVILNEKSTSSSEQYFSLGTSSGESTSVMNRSKNVFNLPEIDDINFNPFATKSKMRMSPPPSQNSTFVTDGMKATAIDEGDRTFDKIVTKDSSSNISNTTCSSNTTNDKDTTVREVLTEDEDTIEGPFLEAEDLNLIEKVPDTDIASDMMNFDEISSQEKDDNLENGELFIDADAFEFLLNQNKSSTVLDSGKESLFLKFDPLFAKRVSSDGVLAALSKVQKRQSTPKKLTKPAPKDACIEKPVAGPSTEKDNYVPVEEYNEDLSSTMNKPMMVVNPAVSSIISPRRSATPPKLNRRSLTFTSPAMAVIDRLLSLSGNSSHLDNNTSIPLVSREQSETDLAITQLRELLAEKEIHVHNLRCESKELKGRLAALEVQVKNLEAESTERLTKINDLNERLSEKTKINKSMAIVVEEYERTIASLIAETEQDKKRNAEERMRLIKERDEQTAHLTSMEVSFNDLHSKYEKSKQIILSCKANEDTYKKSIKEFEDNFTKMQNNYELLKQHATSKLNHANQELLKMNRAHEAEVLKLNAMIKRKDLHITSLEETLTQKTKANEELTAICDELINKVG